MYDRRLGSLLGLALAAGVSLIPRVAWATGMHSDYVSGGLTFALLIMSAAYWLVYRSLTTDLLRDRMVFVQIGVTVLAGIAISLEFLPAFFLIAAPLGYQLVKTRRWAGLVLLVLSFAIFPFLVLIFAVLLNR